MNNEQMLAAVLALPGADLMTASKIDDPIGAGNYYRADTVVRLLAAERERCAVLVETRDVSGHDGYIETSGDLLDALAGCIRRGA
jgi:hypothetical protein